MIIVALEDGRLRRADWRASHLRARACSRYMRQPGTTKNLDLMMSLFADDATLTAGEKTYSGKEQIGSFWQGAGTFQPQNQWVAYTPAFRIKYDVNGNTAHLYFECLYVDKAANKIAAHTNSDDALIRVNGRWLIKEMKASVVPEL
jgi:hypothetical protein